eukprot:gene27568-36276_t
MSAMKRMKKSRYSIANDDETMLCEAVELMSYDRLRNTLSDHKPVKAMLNLKVKRSGCRDEWLNLSIVAGKIPKSGEIAEIVVSNDHTATTLRYSELLEGMQSISPEKMPKLGPYIHPPSLYHSQEVYCVLTLRIFITRPQGFTTTTTTTNNTKENNMLLDEKECDENTKQQLCQ